MNGADPNIATEVRKERGVRFVLREGGQRKMCPFCWYNNGHHSWWCNRPLRRAS